MTQLVTLSQQTSVRSDRGRLRVVKPLDREVGAGLSQMPRHGLVPGRSHALDLQGREVHRDGPQHRKNQHHHHCSDQRRPLLASILLSVVPYHGHLLYPSQRARRPMSFVITRRSPPTDTSTRTRATRVGSWVHLPSGSRYTSRNQVTSPIRVLAPPST